MKLIKALILIIFSNVVLAQSSKTINSDNSIEGQFKSLYKESGSYQVYKVIKKTAYASLQKNTVDSIKKLKSTIKSKQDLINNQTSTLKSLNKEIQSLNNNLSESSKKEDQISFIGIDLTKSNYNLIVWSIILTLLGFLIYFIYRFKNSNKTTKEARKSFDEIELEFEQHRKKSIEKEQQLRRKLQDEINKQRGV
ncbi:conserved exported hypothetical protein [Tenacibaculum sp. 190524A02b]|uniref:tRNA (Guanine-N1)-methyltransferase n=1 Tax=Tenacibaculum vairaonense TaxID=3137860 RepID=A0ABP1FE63_9FLAO